MLLADNTNKSEKKSENSEKLNSFCISSYYLPRPLFVLNRGIYSVLGLLVIVVFDYISK